MHENLDRIKELLARGKEKYRTSMSNPNTRATVIGAISFLVLVVVIVIISISMSGKDIDEFVKTKWVKALEEGDLKTYKKLWDKEARSENKKHYEKAVELLGKKLNVDEDKIEAKRDLRNDNLYHVEEIPVNLIEDDIKLLTFRDLKVEKKGWLGRWKIIDDEVDFLEEEIPPLAKSKDSSTNETESSQLAEPWEDRGNQSGYAEKTKKAEGKFDTSSSDSLDPIAGEAPLDTKLKISQVIGEWQVAWQKENLVEYMSKYADEAIITRVTVRGGKEYPVTLTKRELRKRMKIMNRRYKTIKVNISNLRIDGDRAIADVKFRQEFIGKPEKETPIYSDIGTKSLTFMVDPSDGYWKIYEENWKMYVKVPRYPKF